MKLKCLTGLFLIIGIMLSTIIVPKAEGNTPMYADKNMFGYDRSNSYMNYLKRHSEALRPDISINLDANNRLDKEFENITVSFDEGSGKNVLTFAQSNSAVSWIVDIPYAGLYNISMVFKTMEGMGKDINVSVKIDDSLPFDEADSFTFKRIWKNEIGILQDNSGNDLRPKQTEQFIWQNKIFINSQGVYYEDCLFYFKEGKNNLTIHNNGEAFILDCLTIHQAQSPPLYKEYLNSLNDKTNNNNSTEIIKVQAENAILKSDAVLFPMSDRTDVSIEPSDPKNVKLNIFGSYNWKYPGQFATWDFYIPENGFYKIAFKVKQNFNRGMYSSRKIYIDGKVPFEELEAYSFKYGNKWHTEVLSGNKPYLFYLEKGMHQLTMEAVTGSISETLKVLDSVVFDLNSLYRRIIKVTGASPDLNRDYKLKSTIPGLIQELERISGKLASESKNIESITKTKGSEAVRIDRLKDQIDDFIAEPETIPSRLSNFSSNISGLGTLLLNLKEQALTLDYILIMNMHKEVPEENVSFLKRLEYAFKAFLASFGNSHKQLGEVREQKSIEVWVNSSKMYNVSGRDVAGIIKSIADDLFTPVTNVGVNVSLIQDALVQATLAGIAPDAAINVAKTDPINLAMRGALNDLSQFPDFEVVTKRFYESATVPFAYKHGCYGLPETQNFNMLFYRKDIFTELGLGVPQTWDDFYKVMSVIQKNNFQVGIGTEVTGEILFESLLLQNGLKYYNKDLTQTTFDESQALEVFKQWTGFHTNYSLPLTYDFYNRFRSGEMPMALAPYTEYNRLAVAAPELNGLWGFAPIPGTKKDDGIIDRSQSSNGTACIILKGAKDTEMAWEFIKWWTGNEVQELFGREIEALVGPAARYDTANKKAFEMLPWTKEQADSLKEQWKYVKNNYQVPGNYYISRNLLNAFRSVVYDYNNPRIVMNKYNIEMNKELERKRAEFE